MNIVIEKASKTDFPRLNELYFNLTGEISDNIKMEDEFKKFINNDDYYLLVIKIDGYVIGTGLGIVFRSLAANCRPYFVIDNVIIDEKYRNKGYGTLLFQTFQKHMFNNNCLASYLIANEENFDAHRFYRKNGFNDKVLGFQKTLE